MIQHQGKGLALGERIVFLANDRGQYHVKSSSGKLAVKNGTQGTIESIEPILIADEKRDRNGHVVSLKEMSSQLTVRISDNEKVTFNLSDYKHIDHAYALTGHKSQGQTVDWSMVHLSKNLDAYGLYVMMTRHRDDTTLYHNKEEVASFSKFADNIRVGYKDLAVDYTIKPENHEAYFNVEDYKALGREIMQLIKDKGEKVNIAPEKEVTSSPSSSENHTLSAPSLEALLKERKDLARLIVEEREDHKLFVMQAGLTFEKLEITAGLKDRPLTLIEQKAQVTVEQYGAVALEARNMWQEIRKTAPGSLAKSHPDYPKFDELRSERGSLANIIMEAQTLHRPFLKEVTKDLGYGFTTIQKQAIEFQSKQLMQTLTQGNLDHGTSQKLNVLASYVDARDQFAQTWKELKPQLKEAEGTLLKPTLDAQVQSLRQLSNARDKLAYKIVDRFEDYHRLAQSLQISLDTSKIFTQSENGHRQTCIEQYQHGNSQLAKGMAAFELNQLWQAEKEIGSKATVRDLLQNKINLPEVRQEAQAFERIQLQGTLTTDQDKQLFKDQEKGVTWTPILPPRESEFTKRLNEQHLAQYGRPLDMESTSPVKTPRESEFTKRLNEMHIQQYGRPLDMTPSPVKNASTQPSGSNFQKSQSDLLADSFIKRYKEFVTADKDDRTTPSQKEEFKQEIKATFKDEKLMSAIKANNTEIGKEVETLAKSYERQLQQQRGFDMSR
jgi:hypothetical protein